MAGLGKRCQALGNAARLWETLPGFGKRCQALGRWQVCGVRVVLIINF